jgi:hypothetical protein
MKQQNAPACASQNLELAKEFDYLAFMMSKNGIDKDSSIKLIRKDNQEDSQKN